MLQGEGGSFFFTVEVVFRKAITDYLHNYRKRRLDHCTDK